MEGVFICGIMSLGGPEIVTGAAMGPSQKFCEVDGQCIDRSSVLGLVWSDLKNRAILPLICTSVNILELVIWKSENKKCARLLVILVLLGRNICLKTSTSFFNGSDVGEFSSCLKCISRAEI
ncbi:hypothetical protein GOP47_0028004 [Adiantum capillus-veneris]|nr:hypothetical protein GOP47_0028004 [Adiantum capillus-veneris]